jgi:hypothetical protein
MRLVTRLFGLVAVGAFVASVAGGQTCLGYSSFAAGKMNITGAAHFENHATSYGAELNMTHMGMGQHHIIGVWVNENTYESVGGVTPDNTTSFGAMLGWEMKNSMGWEWCPAINVGYTTTIKQLDAGGMIGIGKDMRSMGGFSLAPFLMGGFDYRHMDCTGCDNKTAGEYGIGVGVRMTSGIQITPSVTKTTFDNDKAVFHAAITFPFGGM